MRVETYLINNEHIWKQAVACVRRMAQLGLNVRLRIDTKAHSKSERQLGYVWAALYPFLKQHFKDKLAEHNGQVDAETGEVIVFDFTLDDIHAYHVELFNEQTSTGISKAIDLGFGVRLIKTRMSDWNSAQMSAYIDWLLRFYAVRGVELPEADQYWAQRGIRHG